MKTTILLKKVFNSAVSFLISMMNRSFRLYVLLASLGALSSGQMYAQYSVLQEFIVGNDGSSYLTNEMVTDSTFFYGTVLGGGAMGNGYLFKINMDGTGFQDLFDFDETNIEINNTSISLTIIGSTIYGTTDKGGASGAGMIFMIKTDGTGFIKLHDFDNTNGGNPFGRLTAVNSDLIGTTLYGGSNDAGIVFKYSINENTFQKIFDFDGINGASPTGGLLLSGSSMYGLTSSGGLNEGGVLYKINPDGSGFQKIHDFADSTGSHPLGSLVQIDSSYYGTNSSGGANMMGNVFRINTAGENYEPVVSFDGLNGNSPRGNLTLIENRIYGTTYSGGSSDLGVLFSMYKDRPGYQVLYNFNINTGYYPKTSLIAAGSQLFGTTTVGGTYAGGVLFNYETNYPTTQAYNLIFSFIQPDQMSLQWYPGDGSSRIVFMKKDSTGTANPRDGTSYTASSQFGQGSQIDTSGWYCVYKGTDWRDTITGLEPNTHYRAMVLDFNGGAGNEKYLISTSDNNPMNQATKPGVPGFIETFYFKQAYATSFSYSRNIIADGCTPMISHGICWATHPSPTLADSVHIDGSDVGAFNTLIGHQKSNTTYYARTFLIYPADTIYDDVVLFTTMSVESSIISANDMLIPYIYVYGWGADPNNWVFGSIAGGDANKGTDAGDQPEINEIQAYELSPENSYMLGKWNAMYEGIARCNDAIIAVNDSLPLDPFAREPILAELRFLRAFYYFELIKVFGPKLPWIDETNMLHDAPIPNDSPIWSQVENDFQNAINALPDISASPGRVNVWAARAFYAKLLLYQKKYVEALALFDDVIANGKTTSGDTYALLSNFDDNFNILHNNSSESVFAQQAEVDGQMNMKANPGYCLAYPYYPGPGGCCGFFQPSQSLVNSFKVDGNGLPFFDPSHDTFPFNLVDLKNDEGIPSNQPFAPDNVTPVDPRLDWTVGRRGIPYLDWGIHPGTDWMRDQYYGGPYSPMKNVYRQADELAGRTGFVGGWAPGSELNHNLMRFADVLLMAAECEVELGNLTGGLSYVNQVRNRASISRVQNGAQDAANYQIGTYSTFPSQQFAREAIHFERKLELAMEGHRFFDLVRWGGDYAEKELNSGYLAHESTLRAQFVGAVFDTCQLYFTIPQSVTLYLPQTKSLGDPAFMLRATSTSGLPVSYSVSDTTVVKIKGDSLYIIGLGVATVTAYQSVKAGCLPASIDEKVITIIDINTQLDATNFSCETGSMGYIDLTVSGGTAPYTYLWSNDSTSEDISGLYEGKYFVSVTDANGCTVMDSTNIVLEGMLVIDLPDSAGFCPGDSTILTAPTGFSQYEWSTGETDTNRITVTTQDQYRLVVTDSLGCTGSDTVEVVELPAINTLLDVTNFNCEIVSMGNIDLTVTGGKVPYIYLWSNGSTSEDISGLYPGKYLVSVTDANGCTVTDSVMLSEPDVLSSTITDSTNISCYGYSDGSATVTPTGGTAPYNYLWDDPASTTDSTVTGLYANQYYHITITDDNGCTITDSMSLSEPSELLSPENKISSYSFAEQTSQAVIDTINHIVDIEVLYGTDLTSLVASFTISAGASITIGVTPQESGITSNDFSSPVNYTITAQDGSSQDWVIRVSEELLINSYPYDENFENGRGGWIPGGTGSSWQFGTPAGSTINYAASGNNAWATNLTGYYYPNEISYVKSPVFDFTNLPYPKIEIDIWWHSEGFYDGTNLQYKSGSGSWETAGTDNGGENWYNCSYLYSLEKGFGLQMNEATGWSGDGEWGYGSDDWVTAKYSLFELGNQSEVRFRIAFASNTEYENEGFSFDNVKILASPTGIDPLGEITEGLVIYPNPFSNSTTIKFPNPNFEEYQLIVTDISGKVVRLINNITGNKVILYRDNLSMGFYLIELRGQKIYREKIHIQY